MFQRDRDRSGGPRRPGAGRAGARRGANPVLGLQQALGNRATGRVLARDKGTGRGTYEHSVLIGKVGPIELTESNVADWVAHKADAEDLVATTATGKHSKELKRLADGRTRVDTLEVSTVTGSNSWVVVTFKNAVITGYSADADGTEHWKAIRFEGVDIKRTSIGKPRP